MSSCLALSLLMCLGLVSRVDCSCEHSTDVDLIYNEVNMETEVFCLHPDFILKSGESRLTLDCKNCVCDGGTLSCCSIDQHAGVMSLTEECEVVPDTAEGPCAYKVVRKDDNNIPC